MMTKIEVVILWMPSWTLHKSNTTQPKRHLELRPVQWAKSVFDFSLVTKRYGVIKGRAEHRLLQAAVKQPLILIVLLAKNSLKTKNIFFSSSLAITSWRVKDYEDVLAQLHYVTLCKIETTFHQYRRCIFRYHDSLHNYDNTLRTSKNKPIFL